MKNFVSNFFSQGKSCKKIAWQKKVRQCLQGNYLHENGKNSKIYGTLKKFTEPRVTVNTRINFAIFFWKIFYFENAIFDKKMLRSRDLETSFLTKRKLIFTMSHDSWVMKTKKGNYFKKASAQNSATKLFEFSRS